MPRLLPLALVALSLAGCADGEAPPDPEPIPTESGPAGEPVEDGAILGDGIQEDDQTLLGEPEPGDTE